MKLKQTTSNLTNKLFKMLQDKLFCSAGFYRLAIVAVLITSIIHGSHLFTTSQQYRIWFIDTNILVSSVIDLSIWVLIEAQIKEIKRARYLKSFFILFGVMLLSGLSFIGNYSFNAHYYQSTVFTGVQFLDANILPIVQSCPPLIVILLSTVAEVFVKPEEIIELDYKQRLLNKYMRKVDKKEAKLIALSKMQQIEQTYNTSYETTYIQPVKWSFLGLKFYDSPMLPHAHELTDTLQKMSVSIVHLEQNINAIAQPDMLTLPTQIEQDTDKVNIIETTTEDIDELTAYLQAIKHN